MRKYIEEICKKKKIIKMLNSILRIVVHRNTMGTPLPFKAKIQKKGNTIITK